MHLLHRIESVLLRFCRISPILFQRNSNRVPGDYWIVYQVCCAYALPNCIGTPNNMKTLIKRTNVEPYPFCLLHRIACVLHRHFQIYPFFSNETRNVSPLPTAAYRRRVSHAMSNFIVAFKNMKFLSKRTLKSVPAAYSKVYQACCIRSAGPIVVLSFFIKLRSERTLKRVPTAYGSI